ncbi:MAG: isoaspartyl peptidase/L-asparaginase family protein [Caulobacterales bacterium]|uniref:isoaspartyl peptidase/L-asparaginase family protein n=1 Tax=Glycocaulis sp. TaxID=1969725 RepID=UPI003FA0A8D0
MTRPTALVLHGGAGVLANRSYEREVAHLRELAEEGKALLAGGGHAVDIAVKLVRAMEESALYVAGRGASPNTAGRYELDASIMEGPSRKAGAVAALEGFISPITAARVVMDSTPHVLIAGAGAADIARSHEIEEISDPESYYQPAAVPDGREIATGTVGCVVLDADGILCGATSTGGTLRKRWGRVGDTPIIGSGTWADARVAVSCTGQGEYFMRANAAADVSARMRYLGSNLEEAVQGVLDDIAELGGDGGIIAVDSRGEVSARYNSQGMKHAIVYADGRIEAGMQR